MIETLDELIQERGAPDYLRCDNGSEFAAKETRVRLRDQGVKQVFIEPGNPWQNGFIESFNGRFRDECLDQEIFYSRGEAQVIVDKWRESYNHERPHGALGYRAPLEALARHGDENHLHGRRPGTNIPGGRK